MHSLKPEAAKPLRRGFKAEAERIALKYRKELNLSDYSPLPAHQLAAHLKVSIMTPHDIPNLPEIVSSALLTGYGKDAWSAAIFIKNDKKYIIHNPTHSPQRQESNLMHELAHAVCDHDLKELETTITGLLIPLRKYDHEQEAEAEYLGSCLQLPRKALYHHHHILSRSNEDIASEFTASKDMVRFRLSVTGVTKMPYRKKR